ncbi:MAG: IS1595 family transposase [Candidatus Eremiobacteraeota bacterium]|nr:IS1595 family transposase [Candidatus Eremiobacteraeota bacterium]MBC5826998.1 IS1595 family transposase [Candidatus Eremiobacteraeota bacterium]
METQKALPTTLMEAVKYFSDLSVCRGFLAHLRWPDGVSCPRPGCGSENVGFIETRKIWRCKACKRQFSVKVGTIFEDSPLGLDKWLVAVWLLSSAKNGNSSYELSRALGVTQKTAWFMLHRIRLAMKTKSFRSRLSGEVEADETYIGGRHEYMHNKRRKALSTRDDRGKSVVMAMIERKGDVRAFIVPHALDPVIRDRVREHVQEGSRLYTDANRTYRPLDVEYFHDFVDHTTAYVKGRVHTNSIENFWSLLKRSLKGTYIKVEAPHLSRYVDEQAFRFNTRMIGDGERFSLAVAATDGLRLTYKDLTGKVEG